MENSSPLRRRIVAAAAAAAALLGGCVSPQTPPSRAAADAAAATQIVLRSADERVAAGRADRSLTVPPGMEAQVAFWRNVYARWGLGQAALHDDRHLQLVYAVVELPPPVEDHYAKPQRAYVRERREALQRRLQELERRHLSGAPLSADQQTLADRIVRAAGPEAIVGAAERLRSQRGLRQRFAAGVRISGRYLNRFETIFADAGLPKDLALLPHVESSFQTLARSSAGASGMWQFTRTTGKSFLRLNDAVDERLDPIAAARGAARLLADSARRLDGAWPYAVTAYNHGVGGMHRAKQRFGADARGFARAVRDYDGRRFGFASRNFYAEFLAARDIARDWQRYFPGLRLDPPLRLDSVTLQRPERVADLAFRYRVPAAELARLNPAWRAAARRGRRALPAGLQVWLPAGTLQRGLRRPAPAGAT